MEKKIIKPNIPTIWLDTSVIIKYAHYKLGVSLSPIDKQRYKTLYEILIKKVGEKKLICPEGGREDEIWLKPELCGNIERSLSLGIKLKHPKAIEYHQIYEFMKAYIENSKNINIRYEEVFEGDPIDQLLNPPQYIITLPKVTLDHIEENFNQARIIDRIKNRNKKIYDKWEEIRKEVQQRNDSYEECLGNEFSGRIQGILQLYNNYRERLGKGEIPTFKDIMGGFSLGGPLAIWKALGGNPSTIEGLVDFYHSDIFKEIPAIEISCKIIAKILTESARIDSGDSMDIELIAGFLPYCHALVTDKKMKNRINLLKLDEKYETIVYSISDFDELMNFISKC